MADGAPRVVCLPNDAPTDVTVWIYGLDGDAALDSLLAELSPAERDRASAMLLDGPRRRFVQARSGLRRLLGRQLAVPPGDIALVDAPGGKPRLDGRDDLRFNLSHSGGRAVVALSRTREVGVDIERMDARRRMDAIARRFFGPEELAGFLAAPPADRTAAFYERWTLKEALLKGTGEGITVDLAGFDARARADREGWTLVSFCPEPGFMAALAAR